MSLSQWLKEEGRGGQSFLGGNREERFNGWTDGGTHFFHGVFMDRTTSGPFMKITLTFCIKGRNSAVVGGSGCLV